MELVPDMTPEQLRAMADEMEAKTPGITANEHERALEKMWEGAASTSDEPKRPGYMRTVDVDGVTVDVDMRVVGDIRTLRLIAAVDKGGPDAVQNIMRLFDRLFGEQQDRIIDALSDEDGFCSAHRFTEFCVHLLNEVGAKN